MKKVKFILPMVIVFIIAAFAFVSKNADTHNHKSVTKADSPAFATTFFVFNGTSSSQYTDSTKWTLHSSMPSVDCEGTSIACLVTSDSLSTRSQLTGYIQSKGGAITGAATIAQKKN